MGCKNSIETQSPKSKLELQNKNSNSKLNGVPSKKPIMARSQSNDKKKIINVNPMKLKQSRSHLQLNNLEHLPNLRKNVSLSPKKIKSARFVEGPDQVEDNEASDNSKLIGKVYREDVLHPQLSMKLHCVDTVKKTISQKSSKL